MSESKCIAYIYTVYNFTDWNSPKNQLTSTGTVKFPARLSNAAGDKSKSNSSHPPQRSTTFAEIDFPLSLHE